MIAITANIMENTLQLFILLLQHVIAIK